MTDKVGKVGWLQGAGGDFSKERQQASKVAVLPCGRSSILPGVLKRDGLWGRKQGSKEASRGSEVPRGCAGDIVAAIVSRKGG